MADVQLALRRGAGGLDRLVVVKRLLPHLRDDEGIVQRFLNEARIISNLSHPNIVGVLDLIQEERGYAIVLEYLKGENLQYVLDRARDEGAELPIPIACRIVSEVAHGLHFAHQARQRDGLDDLGFVHRDVAPANVMVTFDGLVKIIDFGVSRSNLASHYTEPGALNGAHAYLSPEAIDGSALDPRSDVFALGAVLFEMLTGKQLFAAESMAAQLEQILRMEIPPPSRLNPKIPASLDGVVLDALRRRPDERIRSAAILRDRLHREISRMGGSVGQRQIAVWMCTMFDEALHTREKLEKSVLDGGRSELGVQKTPGDELLLATAHRRENHGRSGRRWWWWLPLAILLLMGVAFAVGRAVAKLPAITGTG